MSEHHESPSDVPVSAGMPPALGIAMVGFIAVVILIMSMVIFASPFGHAWPWTESTKIPLGNS
ncbi:MAG: hypothetical protein ACREM6_02795 [Vulcanimicrobiaceae bacterium]